MPKTIELRNGHRIGDGERPFIVAEIGNNHNGDMENARELVRRAHSVQASAVKLQTKDIETAFSPELLDSVYDKPSSFGRTYREHKQVLELSEEETFELKTLASELDIVFFSSPFDVLSVSLLERVDIPLYKIASFHVTDLELVERVAATGKPVFMSTGMSTWEEVDAAVDVLRRHTDDFVLLQCTSAYPAEFEDVNLNVIPELRARYDCLVGYSGHERGVGVSPGAVLLGACVIERHFTLDRTMKGPDHAASLETRGLDLLVKRASRYHEAMGLPDKTVQGSELENRMKFRGY